MGNNGLDALFVVGISMNKQHSEETWAAICRANGHIDLRDLREGEWQKVLCLVFLPVSLFEGRLTICLS